MQDFCAVKNLISLRQRHPNILAPPTALVKLSETYLRVCSFLLPHYEKENLDCYARELQARHELPSRLLYKWSQQLVKAVQFLIDWERGMVKSSQTTFL